MASTSRADAALTEIQALLSQRDGLDGVNVFSGPVSLEEAGKESIQLGQSAYGSDTVSSTFERAGMAGKAYPTNETMVIPGTVIVIRPGKGEASIQAARARAAEIVGEIEAAWRANLSLSTIVYEWLITTSELGQAYGDQGRICIQDFTIQATTRIVTS